MSAYTGQRRTPEHEAATARLTQALQNLTERGVSVPCAGDDRFIADDAATLTQAAQACQLCPIRRECAAAGEFETAGVWAGVIRGQATGAHGRRRPTTTTRSDERAS